MQKLWFDRCVEKGYRARFTNAIWGAGFDAEADTHFQTGDANWVAAHRK